MEQFPTNPFKALALAVAKSKLVVYTEGGQYISTDWTPVLWRITNVLGRKELVENSQAGGGNRCRGWWCVGQFYEAVWPN